jgi:hypothetical protein
VKLYKKAALIRYSGEAGDSAFTMEPFKNKRDKQKNIVMGILPNIDLPSDP